MRLLSVVGMYQVRDSNSPILNSFKKTMDSSWLCLRQLRTSVKIALGRRSVLVYLSCVPDSGLFFFTLAAGT